MSFQKIITLLIGEGYEIGEEVYVDHDGESEHSDRWVVVTKRNWRGLITIQNKNKILTVPWYRLEPIDKED